MPARISYVDPLYGELTFPSDINLLIATPMVQRLRHVRLSNIDSIDLPSIANISRFEHVLGVAHLAGHVGFRSKLSEYDALVLSSSALLHDWAITSFGHLVEEALQYAGESFDHEQRLYQLLTGGVDELLGADLQILRGQETGLSGWADQVGPGTSLVSDIRDHIRGGGSHGRAIAGDIDIDNIDNLFRMHFHLGGALERHVPRQLAEAIVGIDRSKDALVFRRSAAREISTWSSVRSQVYRRLMLSPRDFVGKVMLLYAAVTAYEDGVLTLDDWRLTDGEFINRLLDGGSKNAQQAAGRWILGDLWDSTPLSWVAGKRPDYPKLLAFSRRVSEQLERTCFCYGIKDKMSRRLSIVFDDGRQEETGETRDRWLFGMASSAKRPFTRSEMEAADGLLQSEFGTTILGYATRNEDDTNEDELSLF